MRRTEAEIQERCGTCVRLGLQALLPDGDRLICTYCALQQRDEARMAAIRLRDVCQSLRDSLAQWADAEVTHTYSDIIRRYPFLRR